MESADEWRARKEDEIAAKRHADMLPIARPVDWDGNGHGHVYLVDANGKKLASLLGTDEAKVTLAKLLVHVINRRD